MLYKMFTRKIKDKDAVMFDIDDALIRSKDGSGIKETINLLKTLRFLGYVIVIITARPGTEQNMMLTQRQLALHGIYYDHLYFAPAPLKTVVKKQLMSEYGYKFILSAGDLPTDLTDSEYYINTSIFCHN
jgi:ribonucleotide monophosphatase NagD (HAD superfamily)